MSWLGTLAALGVAVGSTAPLSAQIGLASSPQSIQLSAIKQGWVSVSLPAARSAEPKVETSWNIDPRHAAPVTLVARYRPAGQVPEGPQGAIPATLAEGLVLFTQPIAETNVVGARTDALEVRIDPTTLPELPPGISTGTLNLVAITQ
jgi:hypothetical protein